MASTQEELRVLRPLEYHSNLLAKGCRADGRKIDQVRETFVETSSFRTADASSRVRLGNTHVICRIRTQTHSVEEDKVNVDAVDLKIDLPPICFAPSYSNRSQNTAHLMTKSLKDLVSDCKLLQAESLMVDGDDSYWSLEIEIVCLNYDGSFLDAATLALITSLQSLKLDGFKDKQSLELFSLPYSTTFAIIGGHIISEPNLEEENISTSTFSLVVDSLDSRLCRVFKTGGTSISYDELIRCIQISKAIVTQRKHTVENANQRGTMMECQ